mgnify:CR=1 FL=1
MISQLRIYTVNKGMTDQWVKHFTEVLVPMQEKHDIKIGGMWVNEDKNQFIWIRSFANAEDVTVKELERTGRTVRLIAHNPDFAPIEVDLATQPLAIEGRAVGVFRSY